VLTYRQRFTEHFIDRHQQPTRATSQTNTRGSSSRWRELPDCVTFNHRYGARSATLVVTDNATGVRKW
jgi:hypothetical protein